MSTCVCTYRWTATSSQSSTDAPGPANEAPTSRRHFVKRSRTTGVGGCGIGPRFTSRFGARLG
ncbi:MAG: twin-arginine translocation signal domain-containing protein [Candidatus Microthrix sp.]|nr:twin-arginine translocation signal domain-containing protein [Candidatus Microthrix sp.]